MAADAGHQMKIYTLEYVSRTGGRAERLWHANRRALERYSEVLTEGGFRIIALRTLELGEPLNLTRLVTFLNAHCAELPAPQAAPDPTRQRAGSERPQ